jgi:hypothetical protein
VPGLITAYFDCFSGISGDMMLGALLDVGLEKERLQAELAKLPVSGYTLTATTVKKKGIKGTKADVVLTTVDQPMRHLHDIESIIQESTLAPAIKETAQRVFYRLAEAEAAVHQHPISQVHFHEVGAIDAIVDIVGAVAGLHLLDVRRVYCSPINVGSGTVKAAHGVLPVPAPATAELLKGKPIYAGVASGELTTPTGAALITTLSESFGPLPTMQIARIGYGAGTKDLPEAPNLLRLFLSAVENETTQDTITVLEANIDDMNPEVYPYVMEKLFAAGALDVTLTPIFMKKNRPATQMTVLTEPARVGEMARILLRETSTYGVRMYETRRMKVKRFQKTVTTPWGAVLVKFGSIPGEDFYHISPEYESCREVALRTATALQEVYQITTEAARQQIQQEEQ